VQTSSKHCGSCDKDCLDLSCSAGSCKPKKLANGVRYTALAADSTHVFWTVSSPSTTTPGGSVWKIVRDGTAAATLADSQKNPTSLTLVGSNVLFVNSLATGGEVATVPKTGSPAATVLVGNVVSPALIVADAAASYVTTCTKTGAVYRLAQGSNQLATLASGEGACALGLSPGEVVWIGAESGGLGRIRALPKAGGAPKTLIAGLSPPSDLALTATDTIIWVEPGSGSVKKLAAGAATPSIVASGESSPMGVATDGEHVYWTNDGDGTVARARLDGTERSQIHSGQNHPRGIVVDDSFVYWVNVGAAPGFSDTAIMKARK
jgi:hypothetical protein